MRYFPEYWDYTTALLIGFRWKPKYIKMVHKVFEETGDYPWELDVKKRSWEAGNGRGGDISPTRHNEMSLSYPIPRKGT